MKTPDPAARVVKACRCGATYTMSQWIWLRYVGLQEDGNGGLLELRDCRCKKTLALQLRGVSPRASVGET